MVSLLRYERRRQKVAPRAVFFRRLGRNAAFALSIIGASLLVGVAGYMGFERLNALDAFLEAAMLLGGMGPINAPVTVGGKVFAGIYALYAGILAIGTAGIILAPILHRVLHSFHVEDEDDERRDEKRSPHRK